MKNAKFLGPATVELLQALPRWFDAVPSLQRVEFVREYCQSTFKREGQTCMVISYPRKEPPIKEVVFRASGSRVKRFAPSDTDPVMVKAYDLDAGRIISVPLEDLDHAERGRDIEEGDFIWTTVMTSDFAPESEDIGIILADMKGWI